MKVLIVEDTRTITSLLQVYLMGWDLEFVEAKDGVEGLRKAHETRPDLIISDVRMPGMDGFALCAAVRADALLKATPLLLLTSLKDEASLLAGRNAGATAFLSKPVMVDELRDQVAGLLKLPGGK